MNYSKFVLSLIHIICPLPNMVISSAMQHVRPVFELIVTQGAYFKRGFSLC